MFIRWKHRKQRHTAYLVKSVRKDGKPRQEVIATLCSMTWDAKGGLIGWAHLEMKMAELHLSEDEQAHVYKLFAQKVPRPPDEMLEREKQKIAALLAQIDSYKKRVVPDTPPMRRENATTDSSLAIHWSGKVIPHNHLQYTAFLIRQSGEQIELGTVDSESLDTKYNGQFWFSVHRALCLAKVEWSIYKKTLQLLENWARPLDDHAREMTWRTSYASSQIAREIKALHRRLLRLDAQANDLRLVYNHSTSMQCSAAQLGSISKE